MNMKDREKLKFVWCGKAVQRLGSFILTLKWILQKKNPARKYRQDFFEANAILDLTNNQAHLTKLAAPAACYTKALPYISRR